MTLALGCSHGLLRTIPAGTGRDNGATDRGDGSCGDGRVKMPGHDAERAERQALPRRGENGTASPAMTRRERYGKPSHDGGESGTPSPGREGKRPVRQARP